MTEKEILKEYISFVKKNGRYPTREDFRLVGITRDSVRHYFVSFESLKQAAIETGELEKSILDVATLGKDYIAKTLKKLAKHKRFVITTAVANAKVNKKFLESIHTYCRKENAALVILPSLNRGSGDKWTLSTDLAGENIAFFDFKFNSNLAVLGIASNAKAVDPVSGLPRLSRSNGSIICGSPKQNLKYIATGLNKLPHALASTGAVTLPDYSYEPVMKSKQSYLANNDHVMGALIVELEDDEIFHLRQIQADNDGGFADLYSYYHKGNKEKYSPEAMLMGDLHVGETSPEVLKATERLLSDLKVEKLFLGDVFSGLSCNPHEIEKRILLAQRAAKGELSLEEELFNVSRELNNLSSFAKKVYIVRSNHDDFLDRYLQTGEYVNHPYNHKIALKMALHLLDNKNPLEEYCKTAGIEKNIVFLERDASFKVAGIEMANHGDKGQNGAKSTLKGLEESYGPIMVGHSHTAGIKGQAWQVGTSTHLVLSYNQGASSWTHTHGLVFSNGNRQLVNCINGKFTTRKL